MCGIAGIFSFKQDAPPPSREAMDVLCERMAARGPDGRGIWESGDGRLLFGHRRLAVIDPSPEAAQPMQSADRRFTIVFNGEIYNHRALRARLEYRGHRFRTRSDTEMLLALFAEHGEACCAMLEGMYAFAVHDRAAGSLFLARDPYGIKPLYYTEEGGIFHFASQARALDEGVATDPAALAGFALLGHVPEPQTVFAGVKALDAGHFLWLRESRLEPPRRHSSLVAEFARPQVRAPDLPALYRSALRESVSRHLVSDVPVGIFLSGGVDSGAILGLARDCGARNLAAVTLAFAEFTGTSADEAPAAKRLAEAYGADHRVRMISRAELEADLPAILAAMDQPTVDGINTWFAAKAAREMGLKVVLSGIGGDELFGGYSTFRTVPSTLRMARLGTAMPGLGVALRGAGARLMPGFAQRNPKALSVLELGGSWAGAYLLRRGLFMPHELPALLGCDMARGGLGRLDPLGLIARAMPDGDVAPNLRVAALESGNYLRNQLLRDADWAGMAHGVEIRTPLVDATLLHRLAPHLAVLAGPRGKAFLAEAPSQPVPPSILSRPKSGFGIPVASWLDEGATHPRLASRLWARRVLEHFTRDSRREAA
ncbi:MAG: asparagine synthase (glutamine-hydrolyzing) [Methylobacterium mesophilicum]|nr:asparagine synthase (glutamine-hydrolyzing) [Methylobacterium mesophilicum]